MASATRHLCRTLFRASSLRPVRQKCIPIQRPAIQLPSFRRLSSTPLRAAESADGAPGVGAQPSDIDDADLKIPQDPYTVADLDPEERAHYETLDKPQQRRYLAEQNHVKATMETEEVAEFTDEDVRALYNEMDRAGELEELKYVEEKDMRLIRKGYWSMGEEDEFCEVEDDDDGVTDDMITSVAESELAVHREIREYTRIAAWDLPLLLDYAKPFKQPDDASLRFRYTTYLGESHPAQHKVVVEFEVPQFAKSQNLNTQQRDKLIKLVGVRYNPSSEMVKMSCEKFENAAQNKRYLCDMIQKLVVTAKDPADTFQDVPFDFRHHKPKQDIKFPQRWLLGEEREQNLDNLIAARKDISMIADGRASPVNGPELMLEYVESRRPSGNTSRMH